MIRGTTAKFNYTLPYPKEEFTWATIKFWQPHNPSRLLPITKKLEDCVVEEGTNKLCVSLTAEETSRFLDRFKAKMQFRALHTNTGTVFGSTPQLITVYPMNDDIIEENPNMPTENDEGWVILDGDIVSLNRGGV